LFIDIFLSRGWKPLHWAAAEGKADLVQMLLEAGANVNSLCDGHTASWYAAVRGHLDIVQMLARFGAGNYPEPTPEEEQEWKEKPIGLLWKRHYIGYN
jgi:ankyrin repeat protein